MLNETLLAGVLVLGLLSVVSFIVSGAAEATVEVLDRYNPL